MSLPLQALVQTQSGGSQLLRAAGVQRSQQKPFLGLCWKMSAGQKGHWCWAKRVGDSDASGTKFNLSQLELY